jgi:hypothetical protein
MFSFVFSCLLDERATRDEKNNAGWNYPSCLPGIMSILLNEPTSELKLINWLIYNSYHVAEVDRLFIHVFSLYRSQHERNYWQVQEEYTLKKIRYITEPFKVRQDPRNLNSSSPGTNSKPLLRNLFKIRGMKKDSVSKMRNHWGSMRIL